MGFNWYGVFSNSSMLSPLIPISLLFIFKTTLPKRIYWLLFIITLLSFLSDAICMTIASYGIYTAPVIHVYSLLIGCTWFLYFREIINNALLKKICLFLIFVLLIIFIFESLIYERIYVLGNPFAYGYISIMLVVLSMVFFFLRMNSIQHKSEIFDYLFWVNCAVLMYFGPTFVLTIFEDTIRIHIPEMERSLWRIQQIASVLYSLIIAKGIWAARKV